MKHFPALSENLKKFSFFNKVDDMSNLTIWKTHNAISRSPISGITIISQKNAKNYLYSSVYDL